jgi:uncharacterized protein YxeA
MLGGLNQMKKVLRVLVLGLIATLAATAVFAQERDRATVYKEYEDNYQATTIQGKQKALAAAKEYIEKFNTADDKAQVDYFKEAIPALEQAIKDLGNAKLVADEQKTWNAMLVKFDTAFKSKNWDNAIAAGKEALNFQPQYIDKKGVDNIKFDLGIVLTAIGYDLAEAKNNKYNSETIEWAKRVIQQIESGQTSDKYGNYGSHQFKTDAYPDGKNNALGWMNYTIGYITFYGQKNPQAALPYLYKASQVKSATQNFPIIYELIGAQYYEAVAKLDKERTDIQAANGGKDNEESLAKYALEKGYAERGADAYARAYKIIKDDAKVPKDYKDLVFSRLQQLYKFRNNDKTDGLDTYVASIMSKPFPNPTSAVEPIKDEPATTTTSTTPSNSTTNGTNGAKTVPASTTNAKTSATPAKTADTTKTEASTKDTKTKTPANKKPRKR